MGGFVEHGMAWGASRWSWGFGRDEAPDIDKAGLGWVGGKRGVMTK